MKQMLKNRSWNVTSTLSGRAPEPVFLCLGQNSSVTLEQTFKSNRNPVGFPARKIFFFPLERMKPQQHHEDLSEDSFSPRQVSTLSLSLWTWLDVDKTSLLGQR